MGYHRDGSHFPRLSPYEVEMRRRKWAIISLWDRVTSVQVGLPSMIKASQCDTHEPANLLDSDFHENVTAMPKERPEHEHTHMQFLVVKNRLMDVFSEICELTTRIQPSTYSEILALDKLLSRTYESVPAILKSKPLHASITDPSNLIIRRIFLLLVFHKAQITLHRKYLLPGRTDARYTYSRRMCVTAAMEMLQWQDVVERECEAGGRFEGERWKISSVVRMEFLVATTVLCLDLDWEIKHPSQISDLDLNREIRDGPEAEKCVAGTDEGEMACPRRDEMIKALTISYHIWQSSAQSSKEAKKAATVLRILLSKAHSQPSMALPSEPAATASSNVSMASFAAPDIYPDSIDIDQFQLQYPQSATRELLPQYLDQSVFNMDTWLPPDVPGSEGLGFYPDMSTDPYDMVCSSISSMITVEHELIFGRRIGILVVTSAVLVVSMERGMAGRVSM